MGDDEVEEEYAESRMYTKSEGRAEGEYLPWCVAIRVVALVGG